MYDYSIIGIAASVLVSLVLLLAVFVMHRTNRDLTEWVKWLRKQLSERDGTIKELNDRLMAKSLDQFKLWDQAAKPAPEPAPLDIAAADADYDDNRVGRITGKEEIGNAGNEG